MWNRSILALAASLPLLALNAPAAAAELTVFVTGSMADPFEALGARTISYPDPVVATISGGYIESVFEQLGIKDVARGKASLKPMGYLVGEAVQNGEAELGLSFISEFTANDALAVVPFPDALQRPQLYSAGVFAGSPNADIARELIAFVTSPAVRAKLTAAGVVPATAR